MRNGNKRRLALALTLGLSALIVATPAVGVDLTGPEYLGTMVVTAPAMSDPLTVETDPKAPRQPVPASDGASFLKNIPGFSVARKGGTDGDPTFRGLAGSRLNILQNGDYIFGGCGNRMDPPTAYIYPEIFDTVKVIKGPQTVLYGGGNLAGTVLFDRYTQRFEEPGTRFFASGLAGSFGRRDGVVDGSAGVEQVFTRLTATTSQMKDFEDGDGREVHSRYRRWSVSEQLGWTPSADNRVELNLDLSDGEAAYADRSMDGVKFARTGYGVRLESKRLSELVERLEVKAYHNYVDHIMDNFSLRTPTGMRMVSNPDRTTLGGRIETQLDFTDTIFMVGGVDYQKNQHTLRSASSMMTIPSVTGKVREDDAEFQSMGVFAEVTGGLSERNRVIGGVRVDRTKAEALKTSANYGGVPAGTRAESTNPAGFLRYEQDLMAKALTVLAGFGRAVRSPDYWERAKNFNVKEEKSNQIDLGLAYRSSVVVANVSVYYTKIDDFILIRQTPATALNVDATLYGGEADLTYFLTRAWRLNTTMAYTRGEDNTFDTPLAQVAPPEATLGITYDDSVWSAGIMARAVARQDRVHVGYGTIVGQDLGETPGFTTVAINGGYRTGAGWLLTTGVDNLFDINYAEHISKAGAAVSGYLQTDRVNEPGRLLWVKASVDF